MYSTPPAFEINQIQEAAHPRYSVCTLVTCHDEYREMLHSFTMAGFDTTNSEFLFADNSQGNRYDGFAAINRFLRLARGDYIILCHQDIRLHYDKVSDLDRAIAQLEALDPDWAAAGNAGGVHPGRLAVRITDPKGTDTCQGPFPAKAEGLDENFIVVRRQAGLSVSHDLRGFHFYGTDLCLVADLLGMRCYVIDFHLWHKGGASQAGKSSNDVFRKDYPRARASLIEKYRRAYRPRWLQNTGTTLFLSGSSMLNYLGNRKLVLSLVRRYYRFQHR